MLFGARKLASSISEMSLVQRMEMKWNEVDRAADTARLQFVDHLIAADSQSRRVSAYDIEMPSVSSVVRFGWWKKGLDRGQCPRILSGNRGSALAQLFGLLQLSKAKSCLQVGQIVFVTGFQDVVAPATLRRIAVPRIPANAMEGKDAQALGVFLVGGGDHTAFPGGEGFRGVERETRKVSNGANHAALVAGRKGVRGVFNHRDSAAPGEFEDGIHVAGISRVVHRHDSARTRSNRLFHFADIDVKRIGRAIHQHGSRLEIQDRLARGGKSHRRNQDFVAL